MHQIGHVARVARRVIRVIAVTPTLTCVAKAGLQQAQNALIADEFPLCSAAVQASRASLLLAKNSSIDALCHSGRQQLLRGVTVIDATRTSRCRRQADTGALFIEIGIVLTRTIGVIFA